MNKAKFDKEKKNIKLIYQYFTNYGFKHGFWTFLDGICARLKIESVYHYADLKRYEVCKNYLRKHYGKIIEKYQKTNLFIPEEKISKNSNIWLFWWQGETNLPYPVNLCIESIKRHAGEHKVVIVTEKNYEEYVNIPEYITKLKLRT